MALHFIIGRRSDSWVDSLRLRLSHESEWVRVSNIFMNLCPRVRMDKILASLSTSQSKEQYIFLERVWVSSTFFCWPKILSSHLHYCQPYQDSRLYSHLLADIPKQCFPYIIWIIFCCQKCELHRGCLDLRPLTLQRKFVISIFYAVIYFKKNYFTTPCQTAPRRAPITRDIGVEERSLTPLSKKLILG